MDEKKSSGRTDYWYPSTGIAPQCPCCAEKLAVCVTSPKNLYLPMQIIILPEEMEPQLREYEAARNAMGAAVTRKDGRII